MRCSATSLMCRRHSVPGVLSFFVQAEDGIRDSSVTGVQTCALPISPHFVVKLEHEVRESEHISADFMLKFNDEMWSGGSGRVMVKLNQDLPLSGARDVSDEDIDDFLGNFENLATAYRHKVINLDMTDDPFTDYLDAALQDPRVQRLLIQERSADCQYWDRVLDLARSLQISVPAAVAKCGSNTL